MQHFMLKWAEMSQNVPKRAKKARNTCPKTSQKFDEPQIFSTNCKIFSDFVVKNDVKTAFKETKCQKKNNAKIWNGKGFPVGEPFPLHYGGGRSPFGRKSRITNINKPIDSEHRTLSGTCLGYTQWSGWPQKGRHASDVVSQQSQS